MEEYLDIYEDVVEVEYLSCFFTSPDLEDIVEVRDGGDG